MTGAFSFEAPAPTSVESANRPNSGGVLATISGFSFGGGDTTCSVRIRMQLAQSVTWVSGTSIIFDGEFRGVGYATGALDVLQLTISEVVGECQSAFEIPLLLQIQACGFSKLPDSLVFAVSPALG
jgi:hypothetical protein